MKSHILEKWNKGHTIQNTNQRGKRKKLSNDSTNIKVSCYKHNLEKHTLFANGLFSLLFIKSVRLHLKQKHYSLLLKLTTFTRVFVKKKYNFKGHIGEFKNQIRKPFIIYTIEQISSKKLNYHRFKCFCCNKILLIKYICSDIYF